MTSRKAPKDLSNFLLYAFGFMLLWEWIRPLEELTDTANIWVFLVFISISLLSAYLGISIILSGLIKCAFILYALHYLFYEGAFFQLSWVTQFISDFQENIGPLSERDWPSLSNLFRSFLFFVLLWIMTYLIQYWLIIRRQIFIFFFMTIIYITVLDTFTPYEADVAIVRTVILGLTIMGMLTFYRHLDQEAVRKEPSSSRKWMAPLAGMIALSVCVGLAAPKAEPIWPDPVPYLKAYGKGGGAEGGGIQKIGYGTDDTRLGGPFISDNQLVFRAEVESRHYWKVEAKDYYTGKGWIASELMGEDVPIFFTKSVPISSFIDGNGVEMVEESSKVFSYMNYPHIVYPLGIKDIEASPLYTYELEKETEKIISFEGNKPAAVAEYSLVYEIPKYSVTALRSAESNVNLAPDNEFMRRYTQIPEELPSRVRELAIQITEGKNSWFEKARELEAYFRKNGYVYDQENVAIPGAADDYVDQFLFDTKRGYCDNFSTSMAIMARSIGIPARWVKGYTEGEYKKLGESSRRIFEVTNNNAHSWVEIYFPNTGWVPFEPTQGFTNNVQFNYDVYTRNNNQTEIEEPKKEDRIEPEVSKEKPKQASSSFSFKKIMNTIKTSVMKNWKWISLATFIIAVLIIAVYHKRGRWLPYYLAWRFRRTKKDENFPKTYLILLRELDRYGLKRKEGQTLRDYANYVDQFFSSKEMSSLTLLYEQFIYRGDLKEGSWEEAKELWENLIIKTIA
ncbi:transglutaminase domain-containing protein [Bacillus sp. FJAT-29790]|uniref:DUF4129 domain-containing transglutaminase family protein n=1 Tax=Bacillus sp. FJAT-29790 TaxID=1895002 RepID=UPI001C2216FF|nr:transglutaminase domain-containing protein [Bacillus sp. FJAT-29790]MBU8881379.1 transglutaminase domain-containing protein [Bacillus sp. FJAT-29790]